MFECCILVEEHFSQVVQVRVRVRVRARVRASTSISDLPPIQLTHFPLKKLGSHVFATLKNLC